MWFTYLSLREKLIFRDNKTKKEIVKEFLNLNSDPEEVIIAANCIYVETKDKIYIISHSGITEKERWGSK